uniref:G-protein coupled receptors family 1 profile domain-containing protein n=1 Tax=Ascaris lumbricoides TaxID=6252 RepID=A0A9J2PSZ7_ASCLU
MSSQTLCSLIIEHYAEATSSMRTSREYLQLLANSSSDTGGVSLLNRITYAYIAPLIIAFGIIGDIMTVTTLTHPLLRRASIIYTYLILLAMTDFMTLISVIPMILWLLDRRLCTYSSALYYAHIGFPLVNALMGASVWIVVFLTMSQYMAVCHPFNHCYLRSRKMCFWLFGIAYVMNFCIYAPWATKKAVFKVPQEAGECEFIVCERKIELWFKAYEWIRETISRLLPFVLVAYFNSKILITYRITKKDRLQRLANNSRKTTLCFPIQVPQEAGECEFIVCERKIELWFKAYEWIRETISRLLPFVLVAYFNSKILITYRITKKDRLQRLANNSRKSFIEEKSEQEERRLFVLLFTIIIVFFVCTIPAAPLTIFVSDKRSKNLPFQIIRAIINVMEFTKFALNFYFYCLINPDIRSICLHVITCRKISKTPRVKGQPVNPVSQYTRSMRSTKQENNNINSSINNNNNNHNDSSRRSSRNDDRGSSRKNSIISNAKAKSATILAGIIHNNNDVYEKLSVIREGDNIIEDVNERTSML